MRGVLRCRSGRRPKTAGSACQSNGVRSKAPFPRVDVIPFLSILTPGLNSISSVPGGPLLVLLLAMRLPVIGAASRRRSGAVRLRRTALARRRRALPRRLGPEAAWRSHHLRRHVRSSGRDHAVVACADLIAAALTAWLLGDWPLPVVTGTMGAGMFTARALLAAGQPGVHAPRRRARPRAVRDLHRTAARSRGGRIWRRGWPVTARRFVGATAFCRPGLSRWLGRCLQVQRRRLRDAAGRRAAGCAHWNRRRQPASGPAGVCCRQRPG